MEKSILTITLLICITISTTYSQYYDYHQKRRGPNMEGYRPIDTNRTENELNTTKFDTVTVSKEMIKTTLKKIGTDNNKKNIIYKFNDNYLLDYRKGFNDGENNKKMVGPVMAGCCLGPFGVLIVNNSDNEPEIYPENITHREAYRQGYKNSARKKAVTTAAGTTIILAVISILVTLM